MYKTQSGFVVIVTMLVMAALLGLGLSVAEQGTQDSAESGNQSEAVRVFNAAEAGVEEILSNQNLSDSGGIQNLSALSGFNDANIRYSVTANTALKTYLLQGGTASIDLPSGYSNPVTIKWDTDSTTCNDAALLIVSYYDDGVSKVQYDGTNPVCNTTKVAGFTAASSGSGGYDNSFIYLPPANTKLIRIKSLLADTTLAVEQNFPDPQSYTVRSEATGDGSEPVTRTIEVSKTIEAPPAILDYAVYTGGSITK